MKVDVIGDVKKKPQTVCPHCKRFILMTLNAWEEDVSRIVEDKCPYCGGVIVAGLLILCDGDIKRLMGQIQAIIDLFRNSGANVVSG